MPISYVYSGNPLEGTANDDFMIGFAGSTGTSNNTINGNGGDDWVLADSSNLYLPSQATLNGSIATAFALDSLSQWTTDENPTFGSAATPHTTALVEGTIGQAEYFSVSVGAGQSLTVDIDYGYSSPVGVQDDLIVEVLNANGTILATFDDSQITQGGLGSYPLDPDGTHSRDPFGVYTPSTGAIYYLRVRPYGGGPSGTFDLNATFVLNLSVTGHAITASSAMGSDTIDGGDGHDQLFGQGGADTIVGGLGNDLIHSGSGDDTVSGGDGDDTLHGGGGAGDVVHGDDGNDVLRSGGTGSYFGDAGDDRVFASSGTPESLDGGDGIDTLDVSTFAFAYQVNLVTGVTNYGGESFTNFENLVSGVGDDTITGTGGANDISTNAGTDVVDAGAGNDVVAGGDDADDLDGGTGADIASYRTSAGGVTVSLAAGSTSGGDAEGDTLASFEGLWGSGFGDTLTGNAVANELRGYAGADILSGEAGHDLLDGGTGDDSMTGGIGNDTYFMDSLSDVIVELPGEGTDTLAVGFSHALANGSPLENLATIDPAATTAINLTGNSGVNQITGNAGANVLNGAGGADTLVGGLGDDWYQVDNAADVVLEFAGQGSNDRIAASVSYTQATSVHVERLTTSDNAGTAAINLSGNELANLIYGNAGANILNGKGGADAMVGLGGDDWYYVDNSGDVISEAAGGGTIDRAFASVSYALAAGAQVERLSTIDTAATTAINLSGSAIANVIYGNAGANMLDGKGGADTMVGLGGNDWYYVDSAGDLVTEGAAEGADDRVLASVSYTLAAGLYVERLATTDNNGVAAINLTGNELANLIYGNGGANAINGQSGADTMVGLAGNDTYYVDNAADVIGEAVGGGSNDQVLAGVSYALAASAEVERMYTADNASTAPINLIGNGFANLIYGNAGANVLDGKGGADTLAGLGGDDWYYVDNAADAISETAGNGANDRIFASVSYTQGAGVQVERLSTIDSAAATAINLTGNELANLIYGNAGANVLDGKGGIDTLVGLAGADTFAFTTAPGAGNIDVVSGFVAADDTIRLENAQFAGLAAGALAAGAFNTAAAATQADDRIVYNSATGALLFDVDGVGGVAAVQFATLAGGLTLTSADFFVI